MNFTDDERYHFSISDLPLNPPQKKTVKIPPNMRCGWILTPFQVTGHLKVIATGEVLDLFKLCSENGLKPGKANRTAVQFVASTSGSSRGSSPVSSHHGTPAAVETTVAATTGASPLANEQQQQQPAAAAAAAASSKPRPIAFEEQAKAAANNGVKVGTPTPNNDTPRSAQATATATTTTNNNNNSVRPTPTAGKSGYATPTASSPSATAAGAAVAARHHNTPMLAGSAAIRAAHAEFDATAGQLTRDSSGRHVGLNSPGPRSKTPPASPNRGGGGGGGSSNVYSPGKPQQQLSPSAINSNYSSSSSFAPPGTLIKMASLSNIQLEESNQFTVVDGVATLQRPRNSAGMPEPASSAQDSAKSKNVREEVVEVAHGDSLSRVSSTLNTPRKSTTPLAGGVGASVLSPSRGGANATPKASTTASPSHHQQQQQQQAVVPLQHALGTDEQRHNVRVANANNHQASFSASAAGTAASKSRGLPPVVGGVSTATTTTATAIRTIEPLEGASVSAAAVSYYPQDPVIVAYVQLPDGRREPVYYKEGAAKPVFLVNGVNAAAAGNGAASAAAADEPMYFISTPKSAAAERHAASATVATAASTTTGGAGNDTPTHQPQSGGRFGAPTGNKQQQTAAAGAVVSSTNRFASPVVVGRNNFFDQEMHTAAESVLNPMSAAELNEQVNDLRTILFGEQQRREELEGRLTHLFGVADSWATLRHTLTTAQIGSSVAASGSRQESMYGANETPRNSALFYNPLLSVQPQSSSSYGGGGGAFMRVTHEEAQVLAEHERQMEELRRQRLVLQAAIGQERRKSPQNGM